jgi:hypothetical protein
VKAGEFPGDVTARDLGLPDGAIAILTFYEAFSGSLDAALALHNAVLPGWEWSRGFDGATTVWKRHTLQSKWGVSFDPDPARALLLAILAAMIQDGEG